MNVLVATSEERVEANEIAGGSILGIVARCTKCDHVTESWGTTERSVRRCLALMREECPEGETNFYVDEND